jgi:hypothetical protein
MHAIISRSPISALLNIPGRNASSFKFFKFQNNIFPPYPHKPGKIKIILQSFLISSKILERPAPAFSATTKSAPGNARSMFTSTIGREAAGWTTAEALWAGINPAHSNRL